MRFGEKIFGKFLLCILRFYFSFLIPSTRKGILSKGYDLLNSHGSFSWMREVKLEKELRFMNLVIFSLKMFLTILLLKLQFLIQALFLLRINLGKRGDKNYHKTKFFSK